MITAEDIIALLQQEVLNREEALDPQTPLFSTGLLDSMQLTSLFLSLEKKYQVAIGIFDVSIENFDTPAQIAVLINRKKTGA